MSLTHPARKGVHRAVYVAPRRRRHARSPSPRRAWPLPSPTCPIRAAPPASSIPLAAVLALAVAAVLANHRSVLAIAEWGARQAPALLATLGFPSGRTPCQSTLQRLFRQLDGDALAAILAAYVAPAAAPAAGRQGVAIDGKAQRGRLRFAATAGCPVHALSAFCHESGLVLAHEPITGVGDKAEAELTVAPALLARIDWRERVLTGDALFCQRSLCQQVSRGGRGLRAAGQGEPTRLACGHRPALRPAARPRRPPVAGPARGADRGAGPRPHRRAAALDRLHRPRRLPRLAGRGAGLSPRTDLARTGQTRIAPCTTASPA